MSVKTIFHVDLDAFFASVEQRDNPALKGKPVIVGADPQNGRGRGVVSTCSYEARRYGIHSAMPISQAYQRCPHGVFLPVDGRKYNRVSQNVFEIFGKFTPHIEPISIDEAFLDMSTTLHLFGPPHEAGHKLKDRIKQDLGITASVGIASVKMAAKIASDLCKPDGLLEVPEDGLRDFLWPLAIEKLWGVGPKTKIFLNRKGIYTIGDVARRTQQQLSEWLGEAGRHLHDLSNGIDPREVLANDEIKSVSHEHTFDQDTDDQEEIGRVLLSLSEQVSRRLRKDHLKGKTLTLKVRLTGFKTYTHAVTLSQKTNHADVIYQQAREMFEGHYSDSPKKIRLVGVRMSNFDDPYVKENLFEDDQEQRREAVHRVVDMIKDRFGERAIKRGR